MNALHFLVKPIVTCTSNVWFGTGNTHYFKTKWSTQIETNMPKIEYLHTNIKLPLETGSLSYNNEQTSIKQGVKPRLSQDKLHL